VPRLRINVTAATGTGTSCRRDLRLQAGRSASADAARGKDVVGTYAFQPSIGEMTLFAYQLCGVHPDGADGRAFPDARMSANMLLTSWANRGVNLWAVDKFTMPLVAGTQDYTLDPQVVSILDCYVTTSPRDPIASCRRSAAPSSRRSPSRRRVRRP
jgi:hypothetical protein